jgi:hypothetical protein
MRFTQIPPTTNPLGMIIRVMTVMVLGLTIHREIREIRKEKREQAKEDK